VLPSGDLHAVLLIPVDDDDHATRGVVAAQTPAPRYVPSKQ